MFAGTGVAADHAYQSEATRFAAVLRLLRLLLLLLLLLMLHLTQQVRVTVPERGQIRRPGQRKVRWHSSTEGYRTFLDRPGGVRIVAGRGSRRPQRTVTLRQTRGDDTALARVWKANSIISLFSQ